MITVQVGGFDWGLGWVGFQEQNRTLMSISCWKGERVFSDPDHHTWVVVLLHTTLRSQDNV